MKSKNKYYYTIEGKDVVQFGPGNPPQGKVVATFGKDLVSKDMSSPVIVEKKLEEIFPEGKVSMHLQRMRYGSTNVIDGILLPTNDPEIHNKLCI